MSATAFVPLLKTKDPQAIKDYSFDWGTNYLGTDTIAQSNWSVSPSGLDITTRPPSHTDTVATVWAAGGTEGQTYVVTNEIVTAAGRTDDKSFTLLIKSQ